MTFMQVRRIQVSPGIDDEGSSARRQLDTQSIVVAMRSAPMHPTVAGVEKQVEIVLPQKIDTSVGKRARCGGWCCRQRLIIADAALTDDPQRLRGNRKAVEFVAAILKRNCAQRQ